MSNYSLVGGITQIVLHPTSTPLPELGTLGDGYQVPLIVGEASYCEVVSRDDEECIVTHTLTFTGEHQDSPLSSEQFEILVREGAVADVELATGAVIRVGWSTKFGVDYPLRLSKTEFVSGEQRSDYPLKKWVWESCDLERLL